MPYRTEWRVGSGWMPSDREAGGGMQVAFIGEIVGFAGETVNQPDRTAQVLRHQNGGDRKILVVIDFHLVAKTSYLNNSLR